MLNQIIEWLLGVMPENSQPIIPDLKFFAYPNLIRLSHESNSLQLEDKVKIAIGKHVAVTTALSTRVTYSIYCQIV